MTMSSRLATVDEVESGFLCDLVDGLTATRSEHAVRVTIDAWKERVQAAGLDPDEALVAFRESPPVADLSRDDPQRWANPNKRGFVLACIALYSHGRPS
jgi:hypothetical protein